MSGNYPLVTLPNSEVRRYQSTNVDQEYQLSVLLPEGYHESEESYPVIYVTDANLVFGSFVLLTWFPPPVIVVGIGYPVDNRADIFRLRARDFLPTRNDEEERFIQEKYGLPMESGGGGKFLMFIRGELFPFIDSQYRTQPDRRTLFCYSYGGTFGVYTLFKRPDTFSNYIIGAPDLGWDNEVSFRYEEQYAANHSDLPAKVFFAVGTLDEDLIVNRNVSTLFRLHAILRNRNYEGLDVSLKVFEGETHTSALLPTATWGLRAVLG